MRRAEAAGHRLTLHAPNLYAAVARGRRRAPPPTPPPILPPNAAPNAAPGAAPTQSPPTPSPPPTPPLGSSPNLAPNPAVGPARPFAAPRTAPNTAPDPAHPMTAPCQFFLDHTEATVKDQKVRVGEAAAGTEETIKYVGAGGGAEGEGGGGAGAPGSCTRMLPRPSTANLGHRVSHLQVLRVFVAEWSSRRARRESRRSPPTRHLLPPTTLARSASDSSRWVSWPTSRRGTFLTLSAATCGRLLF